MKRAYKFVLALFCVLVVGSGFLWHRWHRWKHGRIVASAHFGLERENPSMRDPDLDCIIREYPANAGPFSFPWSEYIYGCEVRRNRVLLSASAYQWDSFEAHRCSISIVSGHEATFTLDSFRIRWSGDSRRGYTWELREGNGDPISWGRL